MNEISDVRDAISLIARSTAGQLHREEYLTVMLFATLWPKYSGRILGTTGLTLDTLRHGIQGTAADEIRAEYLPKTKDFYPDLLVTAPHGYSSLTSTLSIDAVLAAAQITHLYEFKYLTSFPSLPRKFARQDTYKLAVVGEYIRQETGVLPHMEQFIVASDRKKAQHRTIDALTRWFDDEQFKSRTMGVVVSIVGTDGRIYTAK